MNHERSSQVALRAKDIMVHHCTQCGRVDGIVEFSGKQLKKALATRRCKECVSKDLSEHSPCLNVMLPTVSDAAVSACR